MPKRGKSGWKDNEGNYLVVCEARHGYVLMWLCADDGLDPGGTLGEGKPRDEEGHKLHELAAAAGGEKEEDGWVWETDREAKKALAMINSGMLAWSAPPAPVATAAAVERKPAGPSAAEINRKRREAGTLGTKRQRMARKGWAP